MDVSTSRVTQAEEEGITAKKRKTSKAQREQGDASLSTAPEEPGGGSGTPEAAPSAAPSTGAKKRKKRKSIGQQSTSRAKVAKARSPLKLARRTRKRTPNPDLAEATEVTDRDGSLAKELQKGHPVVGASLHEGEPAHLPEVAGVLDPGIDILDPSAEKLQQVIAQKPRKRKRVLVEELPKKRVKASSTQIKRGPKAPKTQQVTIPAEDTVDDVQNAKKPAVVEAGSLGDADEEQKAASGIAKPRKKMPKQRKRVAVGQQPKKRAKAGIARNHQEPKAQEETSTAEDALDAVKSLEQAAEVEVSSTGQVAEEQDDIAEEAQLQTQKTKPKPKRKKRKSIGQQKPKKQSVDLATPNRIAKKTAASRLMATRDESNSKPTAKSGRPRAKQPLEEAIEEPQDESLGRMPEEEAELELSKSGLESKPKAKRGRPKAKPMSENVVDEPDEEAWRHSSAEEAEVQAPVLPEKKKRGRPRKADTTEPTSQTTKPARASSSRKPKAKDASTTAPKVRAPPKNTIPITIYAPPSPTSSDAEDDPLSTSQPHTATNKINAVDVLSQLCSEILSKSSSALAEQARSDSASTNKAELKRTKHTTDFYTQELASRLLQLTTTLNTNTSLQSRVRAAAKEERGLKKELKQLDKEREDLAVRKEEVMKERKKRELEDLLSGIAGAVKRGWDMQKEGREGVAVAGMVEEADLEV